jgi:2-oxoglutarate ferredoxin oxidoreductase subunit gamma
VSKKIEVRISGLGGQGVVLAGEILGRAAVYDGKEVVETASYGAEARGSAAKSEVIVSDKKIGYPKVRKCDVLVAMSQSALDKNIGDLKENGILIVDKGIVEKVPEVKAKVFEVPATKTAETELKSKMYANLVMLGALVKGTRIVSEKACEQAIVESVPEETKEKNIYGFGKGLDLV